MTFSFALSRCLPLASGALFVLASLSPAEEEPSVITGSFAPEDVDRMIQSFGPVISSSGAEDSASRIPPSAGAAADSFDDSAADSTEVSPSAPSRPGPISREFREVLYADLARWVEAMRESEPELRDAKLIALLLRLNPLHPIEQFPGDYAEALRLHHWALSGSPEALEQLARAFACGKLGALHFVVDDGAADFYRRRAAAALPSVP